MMMMRVMMVLMNLVEEKFHRVLYLQHIEILLASARGKCFMLKSDF